MSNVVVPASGSTLTAAHLTDAFAAVAAEVNAVGANQFDRMALGPQHLGPFLTAVAEVGVSASTTVNTQPLPFSETQNPVATGWQAIAAYLLDNGGSGYTITVPPQSAIAVRLILTAYIAEHADDGAGVGTQAWLAVCWAVDGVAANRKKCWWSLDVEVGTADPEAFDHFAMGCHAVAFDISFRLENNTANPTTPNIGYVQVYAAKNKGATAAAGNFDLENGLLSMYVYPPEPI